MIRLVVLLGLSFAVDSIHAAPISAQVTERDVAVFRAVIRAGLIPEPSVGDAAVNVRGSSAESRTDVPAPAVISQTLRLCREAGLDVRCVPEGAVYSMRVNAVANAIEIDELTDANAIARTVPADLILTVPYDRVFGDARSWSDVWPTWRNDDRKVPECVQFTVPAYIHGAAVVYAQRIWQGRVYGWFVRLAADGSQWHVETKRIVWASHPSA